MKKGRLVKRSIGIVLILLFAAACLVAVFDKDSNAAAPKTVKIGVLNCLTSWYAGHDIPNWNEVQAVGEMINERGGITVKGEKYKVELLVEDGKSTLDGVTAAANRLVFDKDVKVILGPGGPFPPAAGTVTNPNKVIDILNYCLCQPGEIDKTTPYSFLGGDGSIESFYGTIKYLKKLYPKVKRVVLTNADDGSLPYLVPLFKKALQDEGLILAADLVPYSNDTQDFSPIAARLNATKDVDAVILCTGMATHFGSIVKGLRELGNQKPYFVSCGSNLQDILSVAGKEGAKNVFVHAPSLYAADNTPLMNELGKKLIAKHGADIPFWCHDANSLWVVKQVIEAANSFDPTAIKNKWETMDRVATLYGPGRIGGDVTYGIKHHAVGTRVPFQALKDGKVASAGYSPGEVLVP